MSWEVTVDPFVTEIFAFSVKRQAPAHHSLTHGLNVLTFIMLTCEPLGKTDAFSCFDKPKPRKIHYIYGTLLDSKVCKLELNNATPSLALPPPQIALPYSPTSTVQDADTALTTDADS